MQQQLVLSSHNVTREGSNKPSDFTIKYKKLIKLDLNKQYQVGLDRIISMAFTWYNIKPILKNQLIKYSSDGGSSWKDITFPPGVWTYEDFNDFIKEQTKTGSSSKP